MVRESWRDAVANDSAAGQVGLDGAGEDVDRRPLRRHDQVDADCPRHLRQASDRSLDLGRGGHHEVGQLVDDHDEVRQRLQVVDPQLASASESARRFRTAGSAMARL